MIDRSRRVRERYCPAIPGHLDAELFASRLFEVTSNFPGSTIEPVSSFGLVQPKNWHYVKDCVRLRLRVANNEERKVPRC